MLGSVTAQNHLDIRFHDTLTDRLEPLKPVHEDEVRIYTCGPTVYDFALSCFRISCAAFSALPATECCR
jgi:hypothetical protein